MDVEDIDDVEALMKSSMLSSKGAGVDPKSSPPLVEDLSEVEVLSLPLSPEWVRGYDSNDHSFYYHNDTTGERLSMHPLVAAAR